MARAVGDWPWLPIELYIHILSFLPAARDHADVSVRTLLACLSSNKQLRAAALHPMLWASHYRARYTECVESRECARVAASAGDWRVLYFQRRVLDRRALELVDAVRLQLNGRHDKANQFVREFSFDVWDALELEAQLPLPAYFRPEPEKGEAGAEPVRMGEEVLEEVPHAVPRRYWARAIMGVIARHHTLQLWVRLYSQEGGDESITFEEALAGLSAFFDQSPKRVSVYRRGEWLYSKRRLSRYQSGWDN